MSNSYTYLVGSGKTAQAVYYTNVLPSKSSKQIPVPKSGAKADATGSPLEAWTTDMKKPADDTLEGGLYKCSLSTGAMGGSQTVFWIIEPEGRQRDVNDVVGHAVILKAVGSVLNPAPTVVPVWVADGATMGSGKRFYYFQNNFGSS